MSRLFVCLWPPDQVVDLLGGLHRKDQVGARFVRPENWHVTLRFLGDADPNDVAAALEQGSFPAADIEMGPAVDVGTKGGHTLFVPVAGADDLAAEVVRVTAELGTEPIRPRFLGHITIARLKRRANMPRVLGELISASWRADEIALVQSTLRTEGPRYDTLATFPAT